MDKTCSVCGINKNIESFYRRKASPDGYTSACKNCLNKRMKKYREENEDILKEKREEYVENNIKENLLKREAGLIPTEKKCARCNQVKSIDSFYPHLQSPSGFQSWCKECMDEHRKEYVENNLEKINKRRRDRYEADPKRQIEASRQFRQDHRVELAERARKKYRENPEACRKRSILRRKNNPDKIRAEDRTRYKKKKLTGQTRITGAKRRARQRNAEGSFSKEDLLSKYEEQFHLCAYCLKPIDWPSKFTHADHIDALSRGGSNDASNIALACRTCNLKKKDKSLIEFLMYLRTESELEKELTNA